MQRTSVARLADNREEIAMQNNNRRRTAPAQRKRLQKQRLTIIKYALVAIAVFALAYWFQLQRDLHFGADVFYAGTIVNGVKLEGMTYEEAEQELKQLSETLLNGTAFHLYYGDKQWTISPQDLEAKLDVDQILDQAWGYAREGSARQRRAQIRALRSNPIVLASQLEYNQDALRNFVYAIKEEIDVAPIDAQVTVMGFEQLSVSQSRTGLELDADALIGQLIEAMTIGGNFEITLEPVVTEPNYTTQELTEATQLLSRIQTSTTASSSKRTSNIKVALSNFNGMCIAAGETVSFNDVVGERSPENGYNNAMEYAGTSFTEGYGGGVCQASTTLYINLIYAGLKIDERHNHSMTVGYTKPSLDAAVNDGVKGTAKDLVFTNNTDYPIYIFTDVNEERAYVSIYGKKSDYDIEIISNVLERGIKATKVKYTEDKEGRYVYYTDEQILRTAGKDGMRSEAYRNFLKDGKIITQERLSNDYYNPQPDEYWVGIHSRSAA